MINRVRICGLLLATLTASRLPAINYCCTIQASFFHASGPVAVTLNQSANVCVTNLGNNTARVLLAFVNAQTTPNPNNIAPPQILAVREAALDPGAGVCLGKSGQALKNAVDPNNQQHVGRQHHRHCGPRTVTYKEELSSRAKASATPAGSMWIGDSCLRSR